MNRRRLALVFLTIPFAVYAWACSSDSTDNNAGTDAGTSPTSTTPTPPPPPEPPPAPPPPPDDAGDAGPAITCVGNPLTADGGTPDGGMSYLGDAGVLKNAITGVNGFVANDFFDGPQYTDFVDGGALVFSRVYGKDISWLPSDGGTPTTLRAITGGSGNLIPIGNALKGNTLFTTVTPDNGVGASVLLQTLADGGGAGATDAAPALSPNDLAISSNGSIYFTDPAYQAGSTNTGVFQIVSNAISAAQSYTNGDRVNGIALSPDEKTVYVSVTEPTKAIRRFTVGADNKLTRAASDLAATPMDAPDGMAVDVGGNLWVAEADAGGANSGRVEVFSPTGAKWGELQFNGQRPTGVAFGGADNKTLYVTAQKNNGGSASDGYVFIYRGRCAGLR